MKDKILFINKFIFCTYKSFIKNKKALLPSSLFIGFLLLCVCSYYTSVKTVRALNLYGCVYMYPSFTFTAFLFVAFSSKIARKIFNTAKQQAECRFKDKGSRLCAIAVISALCTYFLALAIPMVVIPACVYVIVQGIFAPLLYLIMCFWFIPFPCALFVVTINTTCSGIRIKAVSVIFKTLNFIIGLLGFMLFESAMILTPKHLFVIYKAITKLSFMSNYYQKALDGRLYALILLIAVSVSCSYLLYRIVEYKIKETVHN